MLKQGIPNTKIKIGELKTGDLENISRAYTDCGLNIHGKSITRYVGAERINEDNKNLKAFELTPNPHGEADNKILFSPRYCSDGNLYVNVRIINDYDLQEKFNKKLRDYLLHGK